MRDHRVGGQAVLPGAAYLEMVRDALSSQRARERGLFQQDYIDTLLANPADHITKLRGSELWQVALLEMWLQTHEA